MKDITRYDGESARRQPMREMTRTQRRFVLEPRLTAIWTASWFLSASAFVFAIWTEATLKFAMTGIVLAVVGGIAAIAKGIHREANAGLQPEVTVRPRPRGQDHHDDFR